VVWKKNEYGGVDYVDTIVLLDGRVPSTPDFASDSAATQAVISDIVSEIPDTNALGIDLRYNDGGHPDMVEFMLSYLLNGAPMHLIDFIDRKWYHKELILNND